MVRSIRGYMTHGSFCICVPKEGMANTYSL